MFPRSFSILRNTLSSSTSSIISSFAIAKPPIAAARYRPITMVYSRMFADNSSSSSSSSSESTELVGSKVVNDMNTKSINQAASQEKLSKMEKSPAATKQHKPTTKEKEKGKDETSEILSETKSYFSGASIKMVRAGVDKDKRSHRVNVADVAEGVAGEKAFEFVDYKAVSYPTLETLKEQFGGIPFEDLPEIRIYLSKNNTKVSAVDNKGSELFRTSASIEGFKNAKKKTEVSGQAVGVSTGNKCMRRGLTYVRVVLSGLGPGRMSCVQGITTTGVKIVSLQDRTPLPELGPRPRKVRRL